MPRDQTLHIREQQLLATAKLARFFHANPDTVEAALWEGEWYSLPAFAGQDPRGFTRGTRRSRVCSSSVHTDKRVLMGLSRRVRGHVDTDNHKGDDTGVDHHRRRRRSSYAAVGGF